MKCVAIMLVLACLVGGCSSSDPDMPKFDGSDPHGSMTKLTVGLPQADVNKFRVDCLVVSTGDASLDDADQLVESLPGREVEAFQRLSGMTANQIRERAASLRAGLFGKE